MRSRTDAAAETATRLNIMPGEVVRTRIVSQIGLITVIPGGTCNACAGGRSLLSFDAVVVLGVNQTRAACYTLDARLARVYAIEPTAPYPSASRWHARDVERSARLSTGLEIRDEPDGHECRARDGDSRGPCW